MGRRIGPLPWLPNVAAMAAATSWWLSGGVSAANAIAVYQPKGAADIATSYVNLANPGTNDAAPGVAPSFAAATGWTFNGSSQWLDTGLTPATDRSWSIIVRLSDRANNEGPVRVNGDTSTYPRFGFYMDGSAVYYYASDGAPKAPVLTAGVVAVAGTAAYRNGVSESLTIGAKNGAFFGTIPLGGARTAASTISYFNGKIQAVAIYSATLTAPQVAAISAAMAAL